MLVSTPYASFLVTDNKTFLEKEESLLRVMGSCCVKQELTEEDIHFLKKHTRYDEETIREWYAGFLQVQLLNRSTKLQVQVQEQGQIGLERSAS